MWQLCAILLLILIVLSQLLYPILGKDYHRHQQQQQQQQHGHQYYEANFQHLPLRAPQPVFQGAILIVGAAGFLGYHVTLQLASVTELRDRIIAVDNFNVDYSPAIKRQRAARLQELVGVEVFEMDVCLMNTSAFAPSSTISHMVVLGNPAPHFNGIEQGVDVYSQKLAQCFRRLIDFAYNHSTALISHTIGRQMPAQLAAVADGNAAAAVAAHGKVRVVYTHPAAGMLSRNGSVESALGLSFQRILAARAGAVVGVEARLPALFGEWDQPASRAYKKLSGLILSTNTPSIDRLVREMEAMQFAPVHYVAQQLVNIVVLNVTLPKTALTAVAAAVASGAAARLESGPTLSVLQRREHFSSVQIKRSPSSATPAGRRRLRHHHHDSEQQGDNNDGDHGTATATAAQWFMDWFIEQRSAASPCASECTHKTICGASPWDSVAFATSHMTTDCRVVIYTIATGYEVDALHDIDTYYRPTRCNIAMVSLNNSMQYSEADRLYPYVYRYGNWTLVQVGGFDSYGYSDERKPSRVPKLSPGKFFSPTVEYAVYVDSKLMLTHSPIQLIEEQMHSRDREQQPSVALLAVRIGTRFNLFFHIDHIITRTEERPSITYHKELLIQQGRAYYQYHERFNAELHNLFDGAYMVHDLRMKSARQFRCDWFEEYQRWADRDQVAQAFVLSKRIYETFGPTAEHERTDLLPVALEDRVGTTSTRRASKVPVYVKLLSHEDYYWDGFHAKPRIAQLSFFNYLRCAYVDVM